MGCKGNIRVFGNEKSGQFFSWNTECIKISEMVELIAKYHEKKIKMTMLFNWIIKICGIEVVKKIFGNLVYESVDVIDKYDSEESIRLMEND